jgi:capsular exopolysaccharide synthesis family protein
MESFYLDEEKNSDNEKIDIRKYYQIVLKRWWLILIVTIVVTVPWVLYTFSLPPVYEAKALIRFKSYEGSDPSLAESRTTVLTSRTFAERIVAQLGLVMRIENQENQEVNRREIFQHFSSTSNPVPGKYFLRLTDDYYFTLSLQLDGDERVIKEGPISEVLDNPLSVNGFMFQIIPNYFDLPQEVVFEIYPFRDAVKSFQGRTNVYWNRSGNLMTITLTDNDRYLAAQMTNRLAEVFVEESASLKKKTVENKRKLVEEQLRIAKAKLDESDKALKEFKEKFSVNLDAEQQNKLNLLVTTEREKQNYESYKGTLSDLLAKLDSGFGSSNGNATDGKMNRRYIFRQIGEHPAFNNNSTMLVYRQRLADLEDTWKSIVSNTSEANFRAKEIEKDIELTHVQIETIAKRELKTIDGKIAQLNNKISSLKYSLGQLPTHQQRLSELTRENNVLEKQYIDLLAMYRDATISEAVESEDIEILDPAIVPEFPTNLNKKIQASFGGVLGLFLGVVVAFVLEIFDRSVKSVDDVKKYLKLQVLGTIPHVDFSDVYDFQDSEKIRQIDQQLVTHDYSPTPIGEAYRSLRTSLMFSKDIGKVQSMVITSTAPGDGKSFTAANLSITFAQLKSTTLLIDSDLRRGVLHNTFGVPKEPGFSNYLTNMVPLQSILNETQIPNLTLISCGSLIPNPSELLGSHQMQRFLDEVRRKFELVIFDSPPLNAATDAVLIGTQVDATVIVIRAGATDREIARQKLELFSNVPAKVLGVILNGTTADMAHPGYSYYHY